MSSTLSRSLALCAALLVSAAPSAASTRVGIYALIDDVAFEPSDLEPDRIVIAGTFVVPVPISSGDHGRPVRGLLYFGLSPESASAARADWRALRKAAGTGEVVGFGQYWMPCSRARTGGIPRNAPPGANCSLEVTVQQDRTRATSEPYPAPSSEGVVTVFDSHDDLCPRFGRPSVQIVAELRAARAPGVTSSDIPACSETVGLLPVSSLERVFPTQERDREWAEAAEALILRRLSEAPALKLSELGVECRDTICHIHLAFPDKQYQQGTGNRLAADALNALPGFASGGAIIPSDTDSTMDYFFQRRKLPATTAAQISSN